MAEGGHDPSSILKFEEEKKQQEREQELLKIEEKHLMALLSREGAFIAKQSLLNDIKAHAGTVRKEVLSKLCFIKSPHTWNTINNQNLEEFSSYLISFIYIYFTQAIDNYSCSTPS